MARPLTVAGIFAHPDDETWSLAGSFALLVPKGVRGVVWTATRGQAGEIAEASGATRETLAEVREAEERAAMAVVGVETVSFGEFVDGRVDQADRDQLTTTIHRFVEAEQPDVVVTMEPQGVTAHADHIAVSQATKAAFAAYAATLTGRDRREPRMYYWGVPASRLARLRELAAEAGTELPAEGQPFAPRSTPDEQFTCWVDTSTVAELRWRALAEHRTQAGEYTQLAAQGEVWREVLGSEEYIRVHPAPRPGEPAESSLVDAFGGSGGADG